MALKKEQFALLKAMMREPGWDVLLQCVAERINELNADKPTGQNAFETLRALHIREGKVDGLTEFFDKVEKNAFD